MFSNSVIFAVLVAAQALTQIVPQAIAISKATAAATDLFTIIDRRSQIDSLSEDGDKIPDFKGDITLRGLRFAYPSRPNVPVLHGLNLDVPAGKTTALVGASGSGKSTIFGLLERWYVPDGSIMLDGHPIESLNLQWLRTNVRLVQQEPTLFTGTIFQNVLDGLAGTDMANLSEDDKRRLVHESCQAAFAHDFIQDLPHGYDTVIGERGASLSGGQKQRIVIARSIISKPKVLCLDEATSALDPKAEKIVQQALNNVAKGRTVITIAHRLATIQEADNIVVMGKGETVEQGTHNELLKLGGAYSRLVKAQDLQVGNRSHSAEARDQDDAVEDMDKAITQISTTASATAAVISDDDDEGYGLFRGLFYIVKEQRSLWYPLFVTGLTCIAGGTVPPSPSPLTIYSTILITHRRHIPSPSDSFRQNHGSI